LVGRAFARAVPTARTQRRRWWARAAFGVALPSLRQRRLRQRALPEFEIAAPADPFGLVSLVP
ncbi:hypothetical protein, partial [Bradyrhizobium sp. SZCCHNR1083]|uniref:hypothetical protein n=1 Tax=Bradyrhizobium sp. SZCCHNR1083 TaxID=3057364 RepID=UPI0028E22C2F